MVTVQQGSGGGWGLQDDAGYWIERPVLRSRAAALELLEQFQDESDAHFVAHDDDGYERAHGPSL